MGAEGVFTMILDIITILSIIVVGLFLKNRISALKTTVEAQKNIISSTESFMKIFDVNKVRKFVDMEKELMRKELDERLRAQSEYLEKVLSGKEDEIIEIVGSLTKPLVLVLSQFMIYVNPQKRIAILNEIYEDKEDAFYKLIVDANNKHMKDFWEVPSLLDIISYKESRRSAKDQTGDSGES